MKYYYIVLQNFFTSRDFQFTLRAHFRTHKVSTEDNECVLVLNDFHPPFQSYVFIRLSEAILKDAKKHMILRGILETKIRKN